MARKRFGQHFLHEQGIIDRILDVLDAQSEHRLVEIGPGEGALTRPLVERVAHLSVIEIDRDLALRWRSEADRQAGLEVIEGDALQIDYAGLAKRRGGALRLVGNLPYNISSPLLFALLEADTAIVDMHFMLQKEVVDRMVAAPGSRDYGRLSVTLAAHARAEHLFDVAPGAFRPPPRVMSAVVRIIPRAPDFEIADMALFNRLVTAAFTQRRKTLRNGLRRFLPAASIRACAIDPGERPEQIDVAAFARLTNAAAAARDQSGSTL